MVSWDQMPLFLRHLLWRERGPRWGITVLSLFSSHKGYESLNSKGTKPLHPPVLQLPTWRELSDIFFEVISSSVFSGAAAFLACPLLLPRLTLRGRHLIINERTEGSSLDVTGWKECLWKWLLESSLKGKFPLTLKMRGKDHLNKVKWPWIWMSWKNLRHFPVSLKFDYFSAIRGKHSRRDHLFHPQFPLLWSSKIVKNMTNF